MSARIRASWRNATHPASATVRTALDHHVFALNVENLVLTGKAALDAIGSANTLDGNKGANRLSGLAGNDSIDGGAGTDILIGGAGRDGLKGSAVADAFVVAFGDTAATSFAGLPLTIE